jgi:phosphoribosylanthranilate isomerase
MLGANALGFLVGSERLSKTGEIVGHRISIRRAADLVEKVPTYVGTVLLIHANCVAEVVDLVAAVHPSALQVQSEMSIDSLSQLRDRCPEVKIVKSLHVYPGVVEDKIINEAASLAYSKSVDAILLDSRRSKLSKQTGGTGITHDWEISAAVVDALNLFPVVLAGGLRPENVRSAIVQVKPRAVDVMTGVEKQGAKGTKDYTKVQAFVQSVTSGSLLGLTSGVACVRNK